MQARTESVPFQPPREAKRHLGTHGPTPPRKLMVWRETPRAPASGK